MKYAGKQAFLDAVDKSWDELTTYFHQLTATDWTRRITSKEGKIAWSPKDVCGHVHAWHRLLLKWHKDGLTGTPDLPCQGFNWRQTPELNQKLYLEFRDITATSVLRRMKLSHGRIMKLVLRLNERQLMQPGHFGWTRKLGFISYVSANTDSHYRWALRKIQKLTKPTSKSARQRR